MKKIPLNQEKFAVVDDADFVHLTQWKWFYDKATGYARRQRSVGKRGSAEVFNIYMHRYLAGSIPGFYTDHKNGDKLDNRKENLRVCTPQQSSFNSAKKKGKNPYKGIYFDRGKWRVNINFNGRRKNLGRFEKAEDAARAYDEEAKTIQGEFARLNFLS